VPLRKAHPVTVGSVTAVSAHAPEHSHTHLVAPCKDNTKKRQAAGMASARAASPVGVASFDSGTQCDTIVLREESTPFWDMCKALEVPEEMTRALVIAEGRSLSDAQATEELMSRLGHSFIAGNFQQGINRFGQAVDWKKVADGRYKMYRRFRDRLSEANTLSYQRKKRVEELESLIETHDVIDKKARALEVSQLKEAKRSARIACRMADRMKNRFVDTWVKGDTHNLFLHDQTVLLEDSAHLLCSLLSLVHATLCEV
jgi:predicted DCC family thiol-disulfide oxidoreductase YuxK